MAVTPKDCYNANNNETCIRCTTPLDTPAGRQAASSRLTGIAHADDLADDVYLGQPGEQAPRAPARHHCELGERSAARAALPLLRDVDGKPARGLLARNT
jgi:1,6-anhydro-N-acetylmuramate kinase